MNSTRHLLLAAGLCFCLPAIVRAQPPAPPGVVERAQSLSEQKQFAEAQKLLEEQLAQNPPQEQRAPLQIALADVHIAWATFFRQEKTLDRDQAIVHYWAAYNIDKTWRLSKAGVDMGEIAGTNFDRGNYAEAAKHWLLAVVPFHDSNQQSLEEHTFANINYAYRNIDRLADVFPAYEALARARHEQKDFKGEALVLQVMANVHLDLKRPQEANGAFDRAAAALHASGDRLGEAHLLSKIAASYSAVQDRENAVRYYNLALPIYRELKERSDEANTLRFLGMDYSNMGSYEDGLKSYDLALPIFQELKDRSGEAEVLAALSSTHAVLGHNDEMLRNSNLALNLYRELKNRGGEAFMLMVIGAHYANQPRTDEALHNFQSALAIAREIKQSWYEAYARFLIGTLYQRTGRREEALTEYKEALVIEENVQNYGGAATTLSHLGNLYRELGRRDEALECLNKSLVIAHKIKDRSVMVTTLMNMFDVYGEKQQPEYAIASGKQAINVIQSMRSSIQGLDKATQRSFLSGKRGLYERVAAMLVERNRLEEAEQVLRFLRQEDAFEFARRDPDLAHDLVGLFDPLVFTQAEKQQFLPEVAATLQEGEGAQESRLWQRALSERERAGGGRPALISTFNTDTTFYVLLTTPKGRRSFSVPINKHDFQTSSARLQSALSHPDQDPRPDAHKMYQIVFANGQLEQALQQENIATALWFASGSLRYIPLDALYDGQQYLVQKPRANVNVTLTSRGLFGATTQGPTLAAGVSQAHTMKGATGTDKTLTFSALSSVPRELRSIVSDRADGGTGPFPGKVLLDKEFTALNLERALSQGAANIHIATHFYLEPGGDADSFLLLGDGTPLPLAQWKQALKLQGVGLLTLSACQTGVGSPDATGAEVSSLGEVSQYLGAQSVIVSLWPVADASTSTLMSDFYSRWHQSPTQGKAQALREAQRALLGNQTALPAALIPRGKPQQNDGEGDIIPFLKDPKHPYAHPFYWAPFSLIGNWK